MWGTPVGSVCGNRDVRVRRLVGETLASGRRDSGAGGTRVDLACQPCIETATASTCGPPLALLPNSHFLPSFVGPFTPPFRTGIKETKRPTRQQSCVIAGPSGRSLNSIFLFWSARQHCFASAFRCSHLFVCSSAPSSLSPPPCPSPARLWG